MSKILIKNLGPIKFYFCSRMQVTHMRKRLEYAISFRKLIKDLNTQISRIRNCMLQRILLYRLKKSYLDLSL